MSAPAISRSEGKPFYYTLTFQLVQGLALGCATGLIWPDFGASLRMT